MARTPFGMERARRFAAGWLEGQVNGEIRLGAITGDGLLGGLMVHDISIRGRDGREFVAADSLSARYDWFQLVRGRIVLDGIEVFGANIRIERLPGDSAWNYQHIFARDPGLGPAGPARLIRFDDVRAHTTRVTVAQPEPAPGGGSFVTEGVEGGRLWLVRFDDIEAWLGPVVWQSPTGPGRSIRIRSLSGAPSIFELPASITDVEGTVSIQDSVTTLDLDAVEMPASRFSVAGRVISGADGPRLDLRAEGRADVTDFAWISPSLPQEGAADLDLHIETLADGALSLRSERLEFRAEGAEIDGAFGYVVARTHAFRDVDLRLARVEMAWLDSLLPASFGVDGRLSGSVRLNGPLNGVRTSGNLALRQAGRQRDAQLSWAGGASLRQGLVARRIEAEFRDIDLELLDAVRPGLGLRGSTTGRMSLDGPLRTGMEVRAVMTHASAAGQSALDGVATVALNDAGATANGRFLANPLRLETLATMRPQLEWLQGSARGAVAFDVRADSVRLGVNLAVGEGRAEFGLAVSLRPDAPFLDGSGTLVGFTPAAIGAPDFATDLTGAFDFRITAGDLASIAGSAHAELDSGRVRGFPVERSTAWLRFGDGIVVVDSVVARAPGLTGRARGRFGLVEGRSGELSVRVENGSLEPLEAFLLGGIEDPTQPRLGGSLSGEAVLRGSVRDFDVTASAELRRPAWTDRTAKSIAAQLEASGVGTAGLAWRVRARGDSVAALGTVTDSAVLAIDFAGDRARVDAESWAAGRRLIRLGGVYRSADSTTTAQFGLDSLGFVSGTGSWSMRAPTLITFGEGTVRVDGLALVADSGGVARVDGRLAVASADQPGTRPLDFTFVLDDVAFATLPHQVRPLGTVTGVTNGELRLQGTATAPTIDARLEVVGLTYQGASLERLGLVLDYQDLTLTSSLTAIIDGRNVLRGGGTFPIDLRLGGVEQRVLDRPVEMSVELAGFPAAFAFGLLPGFTNISGTFEGRAAAAGSARDPRLTGAMALIGGAVTWDATGVRYVDAEGTFQMQADLMTRIDVSARTVDSRGRAPGGGRGGTARVTGTLDLTRASDPGFDLILEATRMLATRRREAEIVMSGQATLGGRYHRPQVSGSLRVDGGDLYLDEIYRQYMIVGLEDPLFFDVVDTSLVSVRRVLPPTENPFLRNLLIEDLRLSVQSGSWLRSREMDVEVSGDLTVAFDRLQSDLRMQGTLQATRGTYRLEYPGFARVFEVRDGQVEFPGTPGIDPNLNIEAVYKARTAGGEPLDIYAVVSGSLQNPRVRLRSDTEPPISESDLASYLFFGAPTYAFNFGSAATGESGVFGGLGSRAFTASGLGYFASGLQTLAQNFGLVDFVGLTAARRPVRASRGRARRDSCGHPYRDRPLHHAAPVRGVHPAAGLGEPERRCPDRVADRADLHARGLRGRPLRARPFVHAQPAHRGAQGLRLLPLPGVELLTRTGAAIRRVCSHRTRTRATEMEIENADDAGVPADGRPHRAARGAGRRVRRPERGHAVLRRGRRDEPRHVLVQRPDRHEDVQGARHRAADAPDLFDMVDRLRQRAGLPMPTVAIAPSQQPNAFATGRNAERAVVCCTAGLLQLVSKAELEGVLAHELAHIKHRHMLVGTLAATMAGAVAMLGNVIKWGAIFGMGGRDRDDANPIALIAMAIVAPIAAMILQMAISRQNEFQADRTASLISGNPLALAGALRKLDGYAHRIPMQVNPAAAQLAIVNPARGRPWPRPDAHVQHAPGDRGPRRAARGVCRRARIRPSRGLSRPCRHTKVRSCHPPAAP